MFDIVAELVGASLLLVAYWGQLVEWWDESSPSFLLLNALGAGILATVAWVTGWWGFAVLNTVWCLMAVRSLVSWYRASVGD